MEVVQHQDEGVLLGQRFQPEAQGPEDAPFRGFRVQAGHPLQGPALRRQAEEKPQEGGQLLHLAGEAAAHGGIELAPGVAGGVLVTDPHVAAEQVAHRAPDDLPFGVGPAFQAEEAGSVGRLSAAGLGDQAGLPHPGLADDEDDAPFALAQPPQRLPQQGHLDAAAHQWGVDVQGAVHLVGPEAELPHLVGPNRVPLPLDLNEAQVLHLHVGRDQPVSVLADEDGAGAGGRLQPGGQVHRNPHRRVLGIGPPAHPSDNDGAGVDAHPHGEVGDAPASGELLGQGPGVLLDGQPCPHGP